MHSDSSPSSSDPEETEEDSDDTEGDSDETDGDSDETDGDPAKTGEDSGQATRFSGNEFLLSAPTKMPFFKWYDCHCSLDAIRQDLENAGRLDCIVASKSD